MEYYSMSNKNNISNFHIRFKIVIFKIFVLEKNHTWFLMCGLINMFNRKLWRNKNNVVCRCCFFELRNSRSLVMEKMNSRSNNWGIFMFCKTLVWPLKLYNAAYIFYSTVLASTCDQTGANASSK